MEIGKRTRLIWTAVIAFLAMMALPMLQSLLIEPLKQHALLIWPSAQGLKVADFVNFYYAGMVVISGHAAHAYDQALRLQLSNQLIAPYTVAEPLYCGYLPFVFPLMAPFALMPMISAYFVWTVLGVAFGIVCLVLFLKRYRLWSPQLIAVFCLVALWSLPSVIGLRLGQVVWLLVGLDVLYFWGILAGRDRLAGIALALTIIKPQYFVVCIGAALGLGRWRLLAYTLLTVVLLFITSLFTLGWTALSQYGQMLAHTEIVDSAVSVMISLRPLLALFLPQVAALKVSMVLLALTCLVVTLIWRKFGQAGEDMRLWLLAFTIGMALLFSPHTHCHDALLLVVAAAALPFAPWGGKESLSWQAAVCLWLLCLYPWLGYLFYAIPITQVLPRWPFIAFDLALVVTMASWIFAAGKDQLSRRSFS